MKQCCIFILGPLDGDVVFRNVDWYKCFIPISTVILWMLHAWLSRLCIWIKHNPPYLLTLLLQQWRCVLYFSLCPGLHWQTEFLQQGQCQSGFQSPFSTHRISTNQCIKDNNEKTNKKKTDQPDYTSCSIKLISLGYFGKDSNVYLFFRVS